MPATKDFVIPDDPTLGEIDTAQDWPIETEWVRARVRRDPVDGSYVVTRPQRRVTPDDHPEATWAGMWRVEHSYRGLTEPDVRALATWLDRRARELWQLERQQQAVTAAEMHRERRRRRAAKDELKRWIGRRYEHLRDIYRDDPPMRYTGGPDGGAEPVPFWLWVPRQLDAEEAEVLAEKKRALKDEYDLPSYTELMQ